MKTWAELSADKISVRALIELDDALVPGKTIFTADHVALYPMIDVTSVSPQPAQGWTYDGKAFTAPAVPAPAPVDLVAYAANTRYAKETSGITVDGVKVATDRTSQALITGAWATTQINPSATIQWKGSDGTFVMLNAAAITGLASAVTAHVQVCFAEEAAIDQGIAAGTIKTTADIDAAFAAVAS